MVLLIILVVGVTCWRRRKSQEVHPQDRHNNFQQPYQYDPEDDIPGFTVGSEEEDESTQTLNAQDYDRWIPIIDLAEQKKKGAIFFDETCSICLDVMDNGEPVRRIWTCKHTFHSNCFLDWVKVNESCPNCKEELTKGNMLKKELELNQKLKKGKTIKESEKDMINNQPRTLGRTRQNQRLQINNNLNNNQSRVLSAINQSQVQGQNFSPRNQRVVENRQGVYANSEADLDRSIAPMINTNQQDEMNKSMDDMRIEEQSEENLDDLTNSQYIEYIQKRHYEQQQQQRRRNARD